MLKTHEDRDAMRKSVDSILTITVAIDQIKPKCLHALIGRRWRSRTVATTTRAAGQYGPASPRRVGIGPW
jgi:hypothetical protein